MKKIIISVTNDIVTDQRVLRIANTLSQKGYEIFIVGRKMARSLIASGLQFKYKRFQMIFQKGPLFYFCFNFRLFFFLLVKKSDILLANDLDTLLPNFLISRLKKKPLVYDSHEYFTEVPELIDRKIVQRIWLLLERSILPRIHYTYSVSSSIADKYNEKYSIDMIVIRNLPSRNNSVAKHVDIHGLNGAKMILYQGTLNTGRGLDIAIKAMEYISDAVLVIVGDGPDRKRLENIVSSLNLSDKIRFLGRVLPTELNDITNQADLGISLEENLGLSYYYALPNKLFDYIHAEVPVLVSSFPEMGELVKKYGIGEVLESRDPGHVANKIIDMLFNTNKIIEWKSNLVIAARELCWENEEEILIKLFNRIEENKQI